MKESGLNINFDEELAFFKKNLIQNEEHPMRALRVHQMARASYSINNRAKILEFIAQKNPELSFIMLLAQLWSFHVPIVKLARNSLENTLFTPAIIRDVFSSENLLYTVGQAKAKWNNAKMEELIVFKRIEMLETNIYVGLKPEACPQLTPFFCFSARNHRFIGRFSISICISANALSFPESVEQLNPPFNLDSRNPPLIATVLECIDQRLLDSDWDDSLIIKLSLHNDLMSIFSFNRNQNFGEGSVLHPYKNDSSYDDNNTITTINGHQYHLDFVHDVEAEKLNVYEFMSGSQTFSAWEIQVFMNDHEIADWMDAVNYPMECNKFGLLNDPSDIDSVSIGRCIDCKMNHFESESCEDLPIMNGHYFMFCFQQFIDENELFDGFQFKQYPLKTSIVFINCANQRNGSRLIPFPLFWKLFRNEYPSLKLSKNWFAPNLSKYGLMIKIPDYIATKFPVEYNEKLKKERLNYNDFKRNQRMDIDIESKIQWFPNNQRNYQLYCEIEKNQMDILSVCTFKEMTESGKFTNEEINELPICKIPVIMAPPNGVYDDKKLNFQSELNREEKQSDYNMNNMNYLSDEDNMLKVEDNDNDCIMNDTEVNDKLCVINYSCFKQIGLNNISEMVKKYNLIVE